MALIDAKTAARIDALESELAAAKERLAVVEEKVEKITKPLYTGPKRAHQKQIHRNND